MKKLAKAVIVSILGWQVRRLRRKNDFMVVAVAGSLGKTSTKLAISKVLSQKYKVQHQGGNYNDIVSVPLIFFGLPLPSLFNPLAWLGIFWANGRQLRRPYPYDIVVVEVGTDGLGQIKKYGKYLKAEIGVLTGIAPEHMEFFDDLDAVAAEEIQIADLSDKLIINNDFCDEKYTKDLSNKVLTYGLKTPADIRITDVEFDGFQSAFSVEKGGKLLLKARHELIAEPLLYAAAGAIAVAVELQLSADQILRGLKSLKPVSGRMQRLAGINGSTIIDDTYNASPEAMKTALHTLYRLAAPQKIAVLGNMNELGKYSEGAHREIGQYCDPKQLDLLVTIGPDANKYLAQTAEAKGCKVKQFDDPYSVGEYLKSIVKKGALILVKGSQNRVFAEETVKLLLADPKDSEKLVRQSAEWLKKKAKSF